MRSPFFFISLLAAALGAQAQSQTCSPTGVCPRPYDHDHEHPTHLPLADHVCFCRDSIQQYHPVHVDRQTVSSRMDGNVSFTHTPRRSTCRSSISNSGFGSQMVNTPLVLMWRDSTGKAVLSQRQTSQYVMPRTVSNPSRVATALQYKTSSTSSQTSLSFEIPTASGSRTIVWAYAQTAPSNPSDPGSTITQHDDQGVMQLSTGNGTTGSGNTDDVIPLTNAQRMLVAHGIIMTMAFLLVLPFGAIFVRLSRTWIPGRFWFATHWIFQWPFAGALITIGFALGVTVIEQAGKSHFSSDHRVRIRFIAQCVHNG